MPLSQPSKGLLRQRSLSAMKCGRRRLLVSLMAYVTPEHIQIEVHNNERKLRPVSPCCPAKTALPKQWFSICFGGGLHRTRGTARHWVHRLCRRAGVMVVGAQASPRDARRSGWRDQPSVVSASGHTSCTTAARSHARPGAEASAKQRECFSVACAVWPAGHGSRTGDDVPRKPANLVELIRIELTASRVRFWRSPN